MSKKTSRPTDANQLGKLIVDIATGEAEKTDSSKNPHAVALGRRGGLKGGKARAKALTKERKSEIARTGAEARWKKK